MKHLPITFGLGVTTNVIENIRKHNKYRHAILKTIMVFFLFKEEALLKLILLKL
jgi:hypothetical protein